jgi:hypothetical protein
VLQPGVAHLVGIDHEVGQFDKRDTMIEPRRYGGQRTGLSVRRLVPPNDG